jgi:hypothetical protein
LAASSLEEKPDIVEATWRHPWGNLLTAALMRLKKAAQAQAQAGAGVGKYGKVIWSIEGRHCMCTLLLETGCSNFITSHRTLGQAPPLHHISFLLWSKGINLFPFQVSRG